MEGSNGIIKTFTDVFSAVIKWIISALQDVVPLFYDAESGFTFFGYLAVIGLAISVFFLLMGVVQNFLHFRA